MHLLEALAGHLWRSPETLPLTQCGPWRGPHTTTLSQKHYAEYVRALTPHDRHARGYGAEIRVSVFGKTHIFFLVNGDG
jgi:hypothetical protein